MLSPDALKAVAIACAAAALLVGFNAFCNYQQQIGYERAQGEHAKLELQRQEYSAKIEALQKDNVLKAEENATKREQDVRAIVAAGSVSADRLRGAVDAIRAGSNSATIETLRATNAALATVFQDCSTRYRTMGEVADGHANDVRTLTEAWPALEVKHD